MVTAAYGHEAIEGIAKEIHAFAARIEKIAARRKKLQPGEYSFEFEQRKKRAYEDLEKWISEAEDRLDVIEKRQKRAANA